MYIKDLKMWIEVGGDGEGQSKSQGVVSWRSGREDEGEMRSRQTKTSRWTGTSRMAYSWGRERR